MSLLRYVIQQLRRLPDGLAGKESACKALDMNLIPGLGWSLEEEMATHSSILAWRIPWTEEPGRDMYSPWVAKSWTQLGMHALSAIKHHKVNLYDWYATISKGNCLVKKKSADGKSTIMSFTFKILYVYGYIGTGTKCMDKRSKGKWRNMFWGVYVLKAVLHLSLLIIVLFTKKTYPATTQIQELKFENIYATSILQNTIGSLKYAKICYNVYKIYLLIWKIFPIKREVKFQTVYLIYI